MKRTSFGGAADRRCSPIASASQVGMHEFTGRLQKSTRDPVRTDESMRNLCDSAKNSRETGTDTQHRDRDRAERQTQRYSRLQYSSDEEESDATVSEVVDLRECL